MKARVYKREGKWFCVFGGRMEYVWPADPSQNMPLEYALRLFERYFHPHCLNQENNL